jgi:hypothetical protein
MGSTSVTGVGMGDSGGRQKSGNHCSCKCSGNAEETTPTPPAKRGCVTRHVVGGRKTYKTGQSSRIRVC